MLEICEEAFVHNPWDVGAARDAAEAAEQLGFKPLAQWLLESVQAQANDADFFRHLAHVHELNESWQKAIQCWERVKKLDPNDEDANRKINALSANATIQRSGLDEAIDKRDEPRPPSRRVAEAELEELKAAEAHARGAAGQGDPGGPDQRRPLPRARRHLQGARASSTRPRRSSPAA